MSFRILILDAFEAHRNVVVKFLYNVRPEAEVHQFDPSRSGRPHEDFDWAGYRLIIMDSRLGKENGLQWFKEYRNSVEDFPPVVFLSSENNVDIAVNAMKLGAGDFLLKKGLKPQRLKQAIAEILPEDKPHTDMLPDVKPLEQASSTARYSGADTQILPETARAQSEARQVVEESEENDYWDEQTQILGRLPG